MHALDLIGRKFLHPLSRNPFGIPVAPLALGAILIEIGWYLAVGRKSYPWREMAASLGVYVIRAPAKLAAPLIVGGVASFAWRHRLTTLPLDTAWGLALLFLAVEFCYYWMHRASHEIRWLWASHMVHHTPEQIHLASAFRLGATEAVSGGWLFHVPLYFLGFNPAAVHGMQALNLFFQFWLHTETIPRLGWLELIFNTPSNHRVHHASNDFYLDRNYGGILIVWDRLFGTYAEERPDVAITYGLVHPVGSLNPLRIVFHEWIAMLREARRASAWPDRLRLLFGRPGAIKPQTGHQLAPAE